MKWQTGKIIDEKTWEWKGDFKRETESLQIAAWNNATRTNYIKANMDNPQENSECRLCEDRDKSVNHIINEYSKLPLKGVQN